MKLFHSILAKISGHNLESTPKEVIIDQMNESRPLPMGRKEFEDWSDRIISGAVIPGGEDDKAAFTTSIKFALAEMVMHLGKTESHKPDAYFIHCLRKGAINQVAFTVMSEIKAEQKAKEEAKKKDEEAKCQEASKILNESGQNV